MSINRGVTKEDVVHIFNVIPLRHLKNEIMPFAAAGMNLQINILSDVSQSKTNTI